MRNGLRRRLDALDRAVSQDQEAAKKKAFLSFARFVLLGYYLGSLKPNESPFEAHARALNYQSLTDFAQALRPHIAGAPLTDGSEIKKRAHEADRRLFAKFGLDFAGASATALEEAITKMAGELPDRWAKWIADNVDGVDHYKEIDLEERVDEIVSIIESSIARRREKHANGNPAA
jgi:hypothetical protein